MNLQMDNAPEVPAPAAPSDLLPATPSSPEPQLTDDIYIIAVTLVTASQWPVEVLMGSAAYDQAKEACELAVRRLARMAGYSDSIVRFIQDVNRETNRRNRPVSPGKRRKR